MVVITVPTAPEVGLRLVMVGEEGLTVKLIALLANPPTMTTMLPVVAPLGTGATMLVALQLVGAATVPLKVTVLLPWLVPKLLPVVVITAPTAPEVGLKLVMLGAEGVTVKPIPLLGSPPTVTTTLPVVAPLGTGAVMLVALQLIGAATVPLKVTVPLTWLVPKVVPVMVITVPTAPEV